MPTTVQTVEAIKAHLTQKFPALSVEYFPDSPDQYRLNHPAGALLISYIGTQYGATVDTGWVAQPGMPVFSIAVTMRKLHGRDGALDILDRLRPICQRLKVPGCKRFALVADRFLGEDKGIWQYALDFGTETLFIAETDSDDEIRITQANAEELEGS